MTTMKQGIQRAWLLRNTTLPLMENLSRIANGYSLSIYEVKAILQEVEEDQRKLQSLQKQKLVKIQNDIVWDAKRVSEKRQKNEQILNDQTKDFLRRQDKAAWDTEVEDMQEQTGGAKFDQDKVRMDLLPVEALMGTAQILTFGAKKYSDRNWEKGMAYSRVYGALLRHMTAWWSGEDLDPETELSHLHHAGCCIMFLQTFVERNNKTEALGQDRQYSLEFDDRPSTTQEK